MRLPGKLTMDRLKALALWFGGWCAGLGFYSWLTGDHHWILARVVVFVGGAVLGLALAPKRRQG